MSNRDDRERVAMQPRRATEAGVVRVVALALVAVTVAAAVAEPFDLGLISFAVVGTVILWHRPDNRIGWLLLLIAGLPSLVQFSPDGDGIVGVARSALGQAIPVCAGLSILLVLLFPTGHLPSPRWRWPARVTVGALAVIAALGTVRVDFGDEPNPAAVPALQPLVEALLGPLTFVLVVIGVGAVVNAFLRLRRAHGDEREQLRWFAFSCAVAPLLVLFSAGSPLLVAAFALAYTAVAVGIGVAVLKYRLYAIDVVINKAVVYGALALFIAAIYVVVVVAVGELVGSSDKPNVALSLIATTIVAVTFQSARHRLQTFANRLVYGQRLSPYEAVSSFAHRVAATISFDHVLPEMAEAAAVGVNAARSRVRLFLPSGAAEVAFWPPDATTDAAATADATYDRRVDVVHQGETIGEIAVAKARGDQLSKHDEAVLHDLASEAGLAMSSLRLTEELQQKLVDLQESRRRLVSAQDDERRRMERDLHDGAQQQLVAIKIKLGLVRGLLDEAPTTIHDLLDDISAEASATITTLRELARGLFPEVLVRDGLVAAVQAHVGKSLVDCLVTADPGIPRLPVEVEANVYFVIREALQNASKYAPGAPVAISLGIDADDLTFAIEDDGPGFDPTTVTPGSGTQNMRDRMEALGGSLAVTSPPGRGTVVRGSVPHRLEGEWARRDLNPHILSDTGT